MDGKALPRAIRLYMLPKIPTVKACTADEISLLSGNCCSKEHLIVSSARHLTSCKASVIKTHRLNPIIHQIPNRSHPGGDDHIPTLPILFEPHGERESKRRDRNEQGPVGWSVVPPLGVRWVSVA